MKKAIKWTGITLAASFMLAALFSVFAPRFGWQVSTVLSGSMTPALKVGGVVVIAPVDSNNIEVGDIICYGSPLDGKLVTHWVVDIQRDSEPTF